MIARGPTFCEDGTLSGSVHILDLESPSAARAFAFDEPGYQLGAYRDVMVRRWSNSLGRTMWDFRTPLTISNAYLVIGFSVDTAASDPELASEKSSLIAAGPLLSDDGSLVLGAAVLLEAVGADHARGVLSADRYTAVEVHRWRPGGRPT